jgi:hypothetical protein
MGKKIEDEERAQREEGSIKVQRNTLPTEDPHKSRGRPATRVPTGAIHQGQRQKGAEKRERSTGEMDEVAGGIRVSVREKTGYVDVR